MNENIPSSKKIGIIGGGQLGYMLIEAGTPMNLIYNTLDVANSPCSQLGSTHIVGSITNEDDIYNLAKHSDIITFEIEHINTYALETIEKKGKIVIPSSSTLNIIKDKSIQKRFYETHQIPTVPFGIALNASEWDTIINKLDITSTFVIKTCTGGYDGKGVQIAHVSELQNLKNIYDQIPVVIEQTIDFDKELSVIVGRDIYGNAEAFEVVEMVFDPLLNLVDTLISPARIDSPIKDKAKEIALKVVEKLNDAGIYAVELFLDKQNNIYVNETAPRPHNSGHHTIESCITSQYEQLNRILMGWPLGSTQQIRPAAMINIIGSENVTGKYILGSTHELLNISEVYIHMYAKSETRPGRKLGHITLMAENDTLLDAKIELVKKMIDVVAV
jgi:5-(carboxyamino)imidazole ribonucleotide synthase